MTTLDLFDPPSQRLSWGAETVYTDGVHMFMDQTSYALKVEGEWVLDRARLEPLHRMARKLGIGRWFQAKAHFPHYDLTTMGAAERAIRAGVVLVSLDDMVLLARQVGEEIGQLSRTPGWRPTPLEPDDLEARARLARERNLALMRRFAPGRQVGARGTDHL